VLAYVDRSAATQNLGVVRRNEGDLDGARLAFEDGLAHAPTEGARRAFAHDLAAVCLEAGDPKRAFELLAPEIEREDVASETLYVASVAARAMGMDATARGILDRLARRGFTPPRPAP
jgi:Flp pilus assembly protein TadD